LHILGIFYIFPGFIVYFYELFGFFVYFGANIFYKYHLAL